MPTVKGVALRTRGIVVNYGKKVDAVIPWGDFKTAHTTPSSAARSRATIEFLKGDGVSLVISQTAAVMAVQNGTTATMFVRLTDGISESGQIACTEKD